MMHNMYSLKDSKAGIFHHPHHATNDIIAMRGVQQAIKSEPHSTLGAYPQDFDLVEIGQWDDETGTMIGRVGGPRHVTTCIALAPMPADVANSTRPPWVAVDALEKRLADAAQPSSPAKAAAAAK